VLEYYRIYNAVLDSLHGTTTATAPQHWAQQRRYDGLSRNLTPWEIDGRSELVQLITALN
jgi:hypothetical protein